MAAGWSELHGYLLGLILEKLDLVAHARFASVCSSWRSVAVENPPINKPLYMALSHEPEHLLRRFIASFIPSWKEARFIGALDGWVVILIDGRDLFLLNKGFNSIIPLPPLPEHLINLRSPSKVVLSSSPPLSSSSSGECPVVFMQFRFGVYYCRLGSGESFTEILSVPQWVEDILFYNGRLYVLYFPDTVVIFDRLLNMVSLSSVAHLAGNPHPRRFLVLGNNVLYIIVGLPSLYSVLTLEGSEVPVNTIGEDDNFQILLNNRRCSLSITTKEHKEFRRDTNYFEGDDSTFVLDTSKDPNKAKAGDPWPLFFIMFSTHGIENLASPIVMGSHKAFVDEKRTKTRVTNAVITNNRYRGGRGRYLMMASGGFQNDKFRDQGGYGGNARSDIRGRGEYPVRGRGPSGHNNDFYQPWAHQNLYGGNVRSDFWGRGEYLVRGRGPPGHNDFYHPWAHQNGYGGNARSDFRGRGEYSVRGQGPPGHNNDFYQPWANQNRYEGNARSDFRGRGEYPVRGRGLPGHNDFYQPWANQNGYRGNARSDFRGRGEYLVRGRGRPGHNNFYQPWANQNGYGGNVRSDFRGRGEYTVRGRCPPGHNNDFYLPWAHQNNGYPRASRPMGPSQLH